jgi:ornithine cyclodeaminase/alanine dehydrogenase-like protein (mu-crystallin family)
VTLLLTNEDTERVLTMADSIAILEELYRDLGTGSAVYRGRTDLFTPTVAEIGADVPAAHQFKTLDGAVPRLQAASIRVTSDVVAFPEVDGRRRRIKIPAAVGGRFVGLVFLFSSATGELLAVLQDGVLQRFSVGAINAIGAKHLSRAESSVVALIGAGGQAGPQIAGLQHVRPLAEVRVHSPVAGEAAAFAEATGPALDVPMRAWDSLEAAIEGADIVVTATNSRVPFLPASALSPGMHLSCLQRDEAMDDCFRDLDVVVFHTRMKEVEHVSADLAVTEERYGFVMHDHPERDVDWSQYPDLGELVTGRTEGRSRQDQRTFFLNSTGVGAQFTAVAHHVYTAARSSGLGHEVASDWFVESVQP